MGQTEVFCYRRWSFVADLYIQVYCELLAIRGRLLHVVPTRGRLYMSRPFANLLMSYPFAEYLYISCSFEEDLYVSCTFAEDLYISYTFAEDLYMCYQLVEDFVHVLASYCCNIKFKNKKIYFLLTKRICVHCTV
jgi:hypothetical protein